MRLATCSAIAAVFVLAAVPAAGGLSAAPPRALRTAGPVALLAADGPLAAAVVTGNGKSRCTQIVLWRPGRSPATIDTSARCGDDEGLGVPFEVHELALGGTRVIWQEAGGGNNLELIINTATVSKPKQAEVSYVENGDGAGGNPAGDWTGYLLADGPLLVFASWSQCDEYSDDETDPDACKPEKPKLSSGALHQVVGGKDKVLRKGYDMLFPIWVDGGRILIRGQDSKLTLLRTSGATPRTFDVGTDYTGAVFQGTRLVVLRPTALDVYDTGTGAQTHSYHLSKMPRRLVDIQSGIAVMIVGKAIRLIKVDTGRGASVTPTGGGKTNAQLEPTGLYWSSAKGLAFMPMSDVLRRFK